MHHVTSLANALLYLHQWLPTFPPRNPKLHTREILWLLGSKADHMFLFLFSKWWVLCGRIISRTPKALKSWTAPPPPRSLIPSAFLHPLTHSCRNKDWHEPQLLLWTSASCCLQSWNSTCPLVVSCRSHPQSTPLILLCFLAMRLITPSNGSLWSPV